LKIPNSKGQMFSTDFILASIAFLFILTMATISSTEIASRIELIEEGQARDNAAMQAANALLLGEGSPANWENLADLNTVSSLGIARNRNYVDAAKLQRLVDLNSDNYLGVRQLLGLQGYGLKVSVLNMQSNQSLAEFGLEPVGEEKTSAVNRIASYNGTDVIVRVKVFKE